MKIIKEKTRESQESYYREFILKEDKLCRFIFDCDAEGNLDQTGWTVTRIQKYSDCINGKISVIDRGVKKRVMNYTLPAIGICDVCGEEVMLDNYSCSCTCGANYTMEGKKVK